MRAEVGSVQHPLRPSERKRGVEDEVGKEQLTAEGWVVVCDKNELMRP
jgi:hypothetical protein